MWIIETYVKILDVILIKKKSENVLIFKYSERSMWGRLLLQGEKMFNWEEFLDPYVQTVGELKIKFRGVRKQYLKKGLYSPIEFVTGYVKRRESIRNKAKLRGYTRENLSEMEDIAGVRVMVQFVDDVWDVLELLRKRKDFKIIEERDYINNQKASGYRSYHVIIEYPIDTIDGFQIVNAEIQIRTLAMNFGQRLNTLLIINMED